MSYEFTPAVRAGISMLIGMSGPTGGGKTYSSMRIASGLAGTEPFGVIDSENDRALHYADEFNFHHAPLRPPFRPEAYRDALQAAIEAGYRVVLIDSMSHEHAGEGGLLDMHEEKLTKLAGTDFRKREKVSMLAWVEPKREHKAFMGLLTRTPVHVIVCFRAEQKVEMAEDERTGKTVIRPKRSLTGSDDGWIPVTEKTVPYELTMSLLFTPDRPGVPKPIKLQQQHRLLVPLDQPISEETGAALGAWAAGVQSEREKHITDLSNRLLELADKLDRRDVFTDAILKNRRATGATDKHVQWLEGQLERAQSKVDEQVAVEADAEPELSTPQEEAA